MSEYKKRAKQDDDGGLHESNYDRIARTREHDYCLWDEHGVKCTKSISFITTTLATKIIQIAGGPHACVLKGGYCLEHYRRLSELPTESRRGSGKDWRDQLVDAAVRARGL